MLRRRVVLIMALVAIAGCADSGTAPTLPGSADTGGYDAIVDGAPVADAATVAASTWAAADDTSINSVADLAGKTVATEANSTAVLALQKAVPTATTLLFGEDAQCVAAVQQGRADAYVLDQGILISDASTNPAVKVVGPPFTQEPYGIGLPRNDPTARAFVDAWLQKIYADGSWARLWKATIGTAVKGDPPAPPAIGSVDGS